MVLVFCTTGFVQRTVDLTPIFFSVFWARPFPSHTSPWRLPSTKPELSSITNTYIETFMSFKAACVAFEVLTGIVHEAEPRFFDRNFVFVFLSVPRAPCAPMVPYWPKKCIYAFSRTPTTTLGHMVLVFCTTGFVQSTGKLTINVRKSA